MLPNAFQLVTTLALATAPLPMPRPLAPSTGLSIERLELGPAHVLSLSVDSLGKRIALRLAAGAPDLVHRPRLCPNETRVGEWLYLHCLTRRFTASLDVARGTLDVVELRGLPFAWDDSGPPRIFYDPVDPRQALTCPGSDLASVGECALRAGDLSQAYQAFREAATGPAAHFAELRLGDIAEMVGDPEQALAAYDRAAAAQGPLRALALLRHCELLDDCRSAPAQPNLEGTPFDREVVLRLARTRAFHDQLTELLQLIKPQVSRSVDRSAPDVQRLLHRLVAIGLESADEEVSARALELYLALPDRTFGPDAAPLARSAAETTSRLGVPRFGAHLLAAVFPRVPVPNRPDHLLRTAELYLAAGDLPHAEAILEFARTQLPARDRATRRWREAELQVTPALPPAIARPRPVPPRAKPAPQVTRVAQAPVLHEELKP